MTTTYCGKCGAERSSGETCKACEGWGNLPDQDVRDILQRFSTDNLNAHEAKDWPKANKTFEEAVLAISKLIDEEVGKNNHAWKKCILAELKKLEDKP